MRFIIIISDNNDDVSCYCWLVVLGYGNLSLSIEGPSKADMDCEDNDNNNACRVMYRPTEPGSYIINIRFAEEHIPGPDSISSSFVSFIHSFIHSFIQAISIAPLQSS